MCLTIEEQVIKYIKEYDKFISKIAYSISKKCSKLEFEDIKQQMLLTLFNNCKKYNTDSRAAASTYFSQIIVNAANNIMKKYWQIKNKANVECISLDSFISLENAGITYQHLICEDQESYSNPEKAFMENEIMNSLEQIKKGLSPFEKKVFKLYVDGNDIEVIAAKVKKSKKTIYNAIASIKEKLKASLE